ncbi:MAG: hypothetical protein AB8G26_10195 [Ilumatobacter sp.]
MQPHISEAHVEETVDDSSVGDEAAASPPADPVPHASLSFDSGVAPRRAHQIRRPEVIAPHVVAPTKRPILPQRVTPADAVATADEVDGHLELAIQSGDMETPVEEYDFLTTSSEFPDAEAPFAEAIESELAEATELAIDAEVQLRSDAIWRSAGPLRTGREPLSTTGHHPAGDAETMERIANRWTGGPVATTRVETWVRPTIPLPITP